MSDLAKQIESVRFTPVRLREGYDMNQVDQALDALVEAARRGEALGPLVSTIRFARVRWREGYDVDEVDAFLEKISGVRPPAPEPAPMQASGTPQVITERPGLLERIFGPRKGGSGGSW